MPAALAVDWTVIEKAAIAGVSYSQLAQRFEIPEGAIRARACRYKWAVAFRGGPKPDVTRAVTVAQNKAVAVTIQESVTDVHARTAAALVHASGAALTAFAESAPIPQDWSAASVAYKVQRLAAGIDKEGAQVRVNVAMFTESGAPVVRAEEQEAWDCEPVVVTPVIISSQALDTEQGE